MLNETPRRIPTIGFVSLGCAKALVDSERVITELRSEGYSIVDNYRDSDLVIVNTCGFINEAIEESLGAIAEATRENGRVIVMGCLGGKKDADGTNFVMKRNPAVLGVLGPEEEKDVVKLVHQHLPAPHAPYLDLVPGGGVRLTPQHYAYLKISEGCNNHCTFCIIPQLRGKLHSRSMDSIMREAWSLKEDGVKEIVVQPTHLMAGLEYADVKDELDKYADKFDKISLGDPLLTSDDDYKKVAAAIKENMASFDDGETALCLMGHGTEADSNADYAKMQEVFKNEGLTQFFVGTVEAEPTCEDVIAAASAAGYKKAVLAPFMVVAGDHANNDMADETDPDSWAAKFVAAGFEVTCLLQGLGQNVAVDDIYVSHVDDAIAKL